MTDAALLALAGSLADHAGLRAPVSLERMTGGKNNRVFRVDLADATSVVLKLYHVDPRDPRDRLSAEWNFITYVWDRGVRSVPRPLARDASLHAGLYSLVPGRRLEPAEIDVAAVRQAIDFVIAINQAPRVLEGLSPGSEACFSLADHIATVEQRVVRLDSLDEAAPLVSDAAIFVAERLWPMWHAAKRLVTARVTDPVGSLGDAISSPCISPSDFGYHNALFDEDGRAVFIDFEYAGRDDPAKLVCDFFCQPEVPVPLSLFDGFVDAISGPLALEPEDVWRCRALLPTYRIKWACIILNEFLALGASRRAFAGVDDRAARAHGQLERARRQLDLIHA